MQLEDAKVKTIATQKIEKIFTVTSLRISLEEFFAP